MQVEKDLRLSLNRCMLQWLLIMLSIVSLFACGSEGDDGDDPNPLGEQPLTGVFLDCPVSGLRFSTGSQNGITDARGHFFYLPGEIVTFSIGELVLGSAPGAEVVTPLDLVADAKDASDRGVVNRLILLQILDEDGDLNNGIQISAAVSDIVTQYAESINFDQETAISAFPESLDSLLTNLNDKAVFKDTHRGPRRFLPYTDPSKVAANAIAHFQRSLGRRQTVLTTEGELRGFEASGTTWQWLGIRYAKPPLGDLRWRPPQPPEAWEGVRDAIAYGDQAPQPEAYAIYGEGNVSEDCLVLNVTAPKNATNLPVMVWLHGGAFGILTGNAPSFNNPASLTTKNVVLVTVNHRLGAFGYLAHPELSAESNDPANPYQLDGTFEGSGNYGQMDLIAALEWIQENIAAFGGNPGNVTLFGQSGGGGKAISLMASDLAVGLFHRVICQSGMAPSNNALLNQDMLSSAEEKGVDLSIRLGDLTISEMRALTFETILDADLMAFQDQAWLRYGPNIDNHYLTDTMENLLAAGLANDVPLLAGANSEDLVADADLAGGIADQMPLRAASSTAEQFIYYWNYVPPGWYALGAGAYHGIELVYTFAYPASFISHHTLGLNSLSDEIIGAVGQTPPLYYGTVLASTGYFNVTMLPDLVPAAESLQLTDTVMTIWTNFAKYGDPSTDTLSWPPYTGAAATGGSDSYVEIESSQTTGFSMTVKSGVEAAFGRSAQ